MQQILQFASFLSPIDFIVAAVFGLILVLIFGAMSGRPIFFLVLGMVVTSLVFAALAFLVTTVGIRVPPSYVLYASLFVTFVTVVFFKVKIVE
jgi:hypothetical protein